ncbi:MAG: hypothetical protein WD335_04030 [Candidatus Paceibacterota bacterium]
MDEETDDTSAKKTTDTTLRAAYVALWLEILSAEEKDIYFGHGQIRILETNLRKQPIDLPGICGDNDEYNELLDVVDTWFNSNFVETFKLFNKNEISNIGQLRDYIQEAVGIGQDEESHVVDNWLINELLNSDQIEKDINQQITEWKNKKK